MNVAFGLNKDIILRKWSNDCDSCIETIFLDGILFDSHLQVFRFWVPIPYCNSFYFNFRLFNLFKLPSLALWIVRAFFIFIFLSGWLLIKIPKLYGWQIFTFSGLSILKVIIDTLQRSIIDNNFERYEEVTIKL
jgi:hypothetical protein